jgi:hypothetical protein
MNLKSVARVLLGCFFSPLQLAFNQFKFFIGATLVVALPHAQAQDLPLADVKPGLEGFALTAAAGNVLERFEVRVLDLVDDPRGFPLILVRGSGKFLDAVGGIGQGFSGSPVYIGGRLVGAISGGFPNADHRLALVTPISAMRRAQLPPNPLALALPLKQFCVANVGCAAPLSLPFSSFGLTKKAQDLLLEGLKAKGFALELQQGSASASSLPRPYKLEPGAAIAAQLATGDVSLGAIGTVTTIEKNQILAFGHPVFADARARFIAMPAYISAIIPSSVVPYKVGSATGQPIGVFSTDHPAAIAGTLGASNAVPLEISLKRGSSSKNLSVGLAPVEDLFANIVVASVSSGIEQLLEGSSPGLARLGITLEFANRAPVTLREVVTGNDVARAAAVRAALMTALIAENPYKDSRIKKIVLEVELGAYSSLRVIKLEPEKKVVKPEELAIINVRLQNYRSVVSVKRIAYKAPAVEGTYRLRVRGASTPRPPNELENPDPWDGILTLDELLERLKSRIKDSDLVIESMSDEPRILGVERFDIPVMGWGYIDVIVQK